MRQSACDVGNHMNFYCGFILAIKLQKVRGEGVIYCKYPKGWT